MADPNGEAAGDAFLAANKDKEGVITLPSGLQYKVLEEGPGMEHPTVSTPCDCHYAGRLLDGSEFDSSYKRGKPSAFAPNQVIKGWTEAMQLMVVGDKWEMYIPWNLAYGAAGKPPKIPAKACLIFVMEIVKIKGETKPKVMVFPAWSADELALWTEKDQAAVDSWRVAKVSSWEGGDAKLTSTYPTKEELDAWLDKQSKASKDKSLWKRTRKAAKAAKAGGADGGAAPAAPAGPPALTAATARKMLDEMLAVFVIPANKAELTALIAETEGQEGMMKMMKLLPSLQTMLAPCLKTYGYSADDLMTVASQLMGFGASDPTIAADTAKLMKAAQGDLSDFL